MQVTKSFRGSLGHSPNQGWEFMSKAKYDSMIAPPDDWFRHGHGMQFWPMDIHRKSVIEISGKSLLNDNNKRLKCLLFCLWVECVYCSWNQNNHHGSIRRTIYEDNPKHLGWQSRKTEITWVFKTLVNWWINQTWSFHPSELIIMWDNKLLNCSNHDKPGFLLLAAECIPADSADMLP